MSKIGQPQDSENFTSVKNWFWPNRTTKNVKLNLNGRYSKTNIVEIMDWIDSLFLKK